MLKRAVICQAPVLIIAHRTSRLNLIDAFDAGADDYVRANDTGSLLSRVIGHHRRARRRDGSVRHIGIGAYILDLDGHCAMLGDMTIHLTPKEFALARLMFSSPMITLPREHIETVVWGSTRPPLSRALAAMVARLRRVLQLRPEHGLTLTGVHAFGYRLDVHGLDAPGPAQDRAVRAQEPHRAA
jgi:DNA-binding response OmpR family regulator